MCIGTPPAEVQRFFDDVVLPGFERMVEAIGPDRSLEDARAAGRFFREHGAQSRPIHLRGIDLVSSSPHAFTDRVDAEGSFDEVLQPGMVLVVEPTAITADGTLGMLAAARLRGRDWWAVQVCRQFRRVAGAHPPGVHCPQPLTGRADGALARGGTHARGGG